VSDPDSPVGIDSSAGALGVPGGVQDVIARVQRLADSPRPAGGYPLAWHVEAAAAGDVTAIAVAVLRGARSRPAR
jgi:hypothetical protein